MITEGAGLGGKLDTDEEARMLDPLRIGGGGAAEVEVDAFVSFFSGKLGFEDRGDKGQDTFSLGKKRRRGGVVGDFRGDFGGGGGTDA